MMINNNPFEGLVRVIVVLAVLGGAIGLLLAGQELLNPTKARISMMQAEEAKEDKDIAQAHTRSMNAIEEAGRQDQIALDHRLGEQWSGWALGATDFAAKALVIAVAVGLVCLAIGAAVFLAQAGRSRMLAAQRGTGWRYEVDWSDEDERQDVIERARQLEMLGRLLAKGQSKHGARRQTPAPRPGIPAHLSVIEADEPEWRS